MDPGGEGPVSTASTDNLVPSASVCRAAAANLHCPWVTSPGHSPPGGRGS